MSDDTRFGSQDPEASVTWHVTPTVADRYNTMVLVPRVVGCWRIDDPYFAFASSFIRPEIADDFARIRGLREQHEGSLAAIFGHADPIGDDDLNKQLSGRRATAVYGLLTRDVALWEELYSNPKSNDVWGTESIQIMLQRLHGFTEIPDPEPVDDSEQAAAEYIDEPVYYSGSIDGIYGSGTTAAVKAFQSDHQLKADGIAGPKTREKLFKAYMDDLCTSESGDPFVLQPSDFLGADKLPNRKGSCQGCSEFNPVFRMSQTDESRYAKMADKAERNARNAPNRRVLILFFERDTDIAKTGWPCPTTSDGPASCKSHFWPDGDTRRGAGTTLRTFRKDRNTFACRWYDRLVRRSPCEGLAERHDIELRFYMPSNERPVPIFNAPYRVTIGSRVFVGRAKDAWFKTQVRELPDTCKAEWGLESDADLAENAGTARFERTVELLTVSQDSDDAEFERSLANLGFEQGTLSERVVQFQKTYGLPQSGTLDADTKDSLSQLHGSARLAGQNGATQT